MRFLKDRLFTGSAYVVFGVVTLTLLAILTPILWRGASALFFRGTVEFRRLQFEEHGRGDKAALDKDLSAAIAAQEPVIEIFTHFRRSLDTDLLSSEARDIYREHGDDVRIMGVDDDELRHRRREAKKIRNTLIEAFESTDKKTALSLIDEVLANENDPSYADTAGMQFFALAHEYRRTLETVDLSIRADYEQALSEVNDALHRLLGPFPGEEKPALIMEQYGATRWDRAQVQLDRLLWAEKWVSDGPGLPLRKVRIRRSEQFAGTELAPMFDMVEKNVSAMLRPRFTLYWRYFLDDSTAGHFFGGVGPEILGTLLITVLTMIFAVPLGIISAAYLIECAGDNIVVRIIRTCINTLAGVPSIVYGLFGLAFFVLIFVPFFGGPREISILAGSLTLTLLVLPIIIRASEEAIRTVPHTYKEAALSLGAGRFWTFISVTLPAALPGILTGIILSLSRAAGETAPLLFTAAVALGPIPKGIFNSTRTLSYGSYDLAVGDRIAPMVPHKQFGMVMTLVALVLVLNFAAILLRARIAKRLRGQ